MNGQDIREGQRYRVLPGARWPNDSAQTYLPRSGDILVAAADRVDNDGDALLRDPSTDPETYYYCLPGYLEPVDAPQSPNYEHGICDCSMRPRQLQFPFCGTCGHPSERHHNESGCVDGVDHPGSVGPMPNELPFTGAHGPSAEQWARGMAMLITALVAKGTGAPSTWRDQAQTMAEQYILTGED